MRTIRIDEEMLHKLHIVADYEGRSANSEILILIREAIMGWRKGKSKLHSTSGRNAHKRDA